MSADVSFCIAQALVQWVRSREHPKLYTVFVGVGDHSICRLVALFHAVVDDFGNLVEVRP